MRFSKAEKRTLGQCWKLGIWSVREILDSLPEEERVAYTTLFGAAFWERWRIQLVVSLPGDPSQIAGDRKETLR